MTPEELAAIRERVDKHVSYFHDEGCVLAKALLAHIDAITEAVEGMETWTLGDGLDEDDDIEPLVERAAVLALLKGEA